MEKEDKELFRKHVQELRKWANGEESRCLLVIAGDKEGGFCSVMYSNYLRMGEAIANMIHREPDLISAMKLGIAAAEGYNRQKKEKKNKS